MEPTLDVGERVLVNRVNYKLSDPDRGDIIVFHPPEGAVNGKRCGISHPADEPCPRPTPKRADVNFIKRVVAGPGDTLRIEGGNPIVNGEPIGWRVQHDRDAFKELWLLFENDDGRYPLYPGESAWLEYSYTVGDDKWGTWFQRAVRLPTQRLGVRLDFPAELDPVVWGTETTMTAAAFPFRNPIRSATEGARRVFSWSTDEPPLHARYRLEWTFRAKTKETPLNAPADTASARMQNIGIVQEGEHPGVDDVPPGQLVPAVAHGPLRDGQPRRPPAQRTAVTPPAQDHAVPARAQASLSKAKELYAAANYDEALSMLNALGTSVISDDRDAASIALYRVLCLVAVGRNAEVDQAIDRLVSQYPLYRPSSDELSPRMQKAVSTARIRLLPSMVQKRYEESKVAYDRGDFATSSVGFKWVLSALSDPDIAYLAGQSPLADIKTLSAGFVDLSEKAMAPPPAPVVPKPVAIAPPPAASTTVTSTRDLKRVFTPEDSEVVAPVTTRQVMPRFPGTLLQGASGVLEIVIDTTGNVESARILEAVHQNYDGLLLNAAKRWQYQPALLDGTPVRYMKRIQISLEPSARPARPRRGAPRSRRSRGRRARSRGSSGAIVQ